MYINNDELEEFLMPSIYVNDDRNQWYKALAWKKAVWKLSFLMAY